MTPPSPGHPRDVTLPAYLARLRALAESSAPDDCAEITWGQVAALVAVAEAAGPALEVALAVAPRLRSEFTVEASKMQELNGALAALAPDAAEPPAERSH